MKPEVPKETLNLKLPRAGLRSRADLRLNFSQDYTASRAKLFPNLKNKIYTTTLAAGGHDVRDLPRLLERLGAVLADIRFAAHDARQLEWKRDYLSLLLKNRYRYLPAFGIRAGTSGGKSTIQHFDLGLKIIESWDANVVLLCDCASGENCHRFVLGEALTKRDFAVSEINDWRCAADDD